MDRADSRPNNNAAENENNKYNKHKYLIPTDLYLLYLLFSFYLDESFLVDEVDRDTDLQAGRKNDEI